MNKLHFTSLLLFIVIMFTSCSENPEGLSAEEVSEYVKENPIVIQENTDSENTAENSEDSSENSNSEEITEEEVQDLLDDIINNTNNETKTNTCIDCTTQGITTRICKGSQGGVFQGEVYLGNLIDYDTFILTCE